MARALHNGGSIAEAAALLRAGELVSLPTVPVYGPVRTRSTIPRAKIYAAKNRPSFNPLIVHVPEATARHMPNNTLPNMSLNVGRDR